MLLHDLYAFYLEHRRCGELDGGVEGERVWMTCTCYPDKHLAVSFLPEPGCLP
jgi:hypothetical protein